MSNLLTTQKQHRELYKQCLKDRAGVDPKKVNELLNRFEEESARVESVEDYLWLQDALDEWRPACVVLGIAMTQTLRVPPFGHRLKVRPEHRV